MKQLNLFFFLLFLKHKKDNRIYIFLILYDYDCLLKFKLAIMMVIKYFK